MTLWKSVLKKIKSIKEKKQQNGSVLVITAIMLPLMLGCLGFAYDFGNLYIHKTRLQNVVDAAALAGGRAYLDSQSNVDEDDRDKYDSFPGIGQGNDQLLYQPGGFGHDRGNKHPFADRAADDIISKNLFNLGTAVINDEYSHYALKSEGSSPRVFYRIGLYEEVPLYFLSVLIGKNRQRVRAGAIALIDDGKGLAPGKTLFDNLFSVEDKLSLDNGVSVDSENTSSKPRSEGGANIKSTFDGEIALTNNKAWDLSNEGDYFYTQQEKELQQREDLSIDEMNSVSIDDTNTVYPNMGRKVVKNSSNKIDAHVSGFLNKLTGPHVDLKKNCKVLKLPQPILSSNLNRYKDQDESIHNHYVVLDEKGNITDYYNKYVTKDNNKDIIRYISCYLPGEAYALPGEASAVEPHPPVAYELCDSSGEKEIYYYFYTEGFKFQNAVSTNVMECFTYVLDSDGNKIFCNRKHTNNAHYNKYHFDFYVKKWNESSGQFEYRQIIQKDTSPLYEPDTTENGVTYYYDDNGTKKSFTIPKVTKAVNLSTGRQINEAQARNSSVYHLEQDGWEDPKDVPKNYIENEIIIKVDSLSGEEYNPLYLIITGNKGRKIKINVTGSNARPLIICNLTSNEISEFSIADGQTFKGIIYSPYSKVVNIPTISGSSGRRFVGNIVAKELDIQDTGTTWTHQNFLESDSDLNTVPDSVAEKQKERKDAALSFAKEALKSYNPNWDDPDWFSSLPTDEAKKLFQKAWNTVRQALWADSGLDMPDWPWKQGGKPTDPDQHHYTISNNDDGSGGEKLRLINFRTEYTIEPYINPFNNLYLSNE